MRRLVITVCPRELGTVALPIERGERARRLDAPAVLTELQRLVTERGLDWRVQLREGCAGGCGGEGPNVDVTIYPETAPARPDHVAVGWKSYVYSLPALDCLARIIDDNLGEPRASTRRKRRAR